MRRQAGGCTLKSVRLHEELAGVVCAAETCGLILALALVVSLDRILDLDRNT